ncbi:hypothetical protein CP02DC21_1615B, partial [Chlamydia psittaci 02DC21]
CQNRFQPFWCGLSRSKPVSDGQNRFELFKTGLCQSKPD